ncbi:hypothetical protein ACHAXT_007798 [Thalassiosira profunda]
MNFANIRDGDEHFYKNSIRDAELLSLIEGDDVCGCDSEETLTLPAAWMISKATSSS